MLDIGMIRRFEDLVRKAEKLTITDIKEGELDAEPDITGRYLTRIKDIINASEEKNGIVFRAYVQQSMGSKSSEVEYGADFAGVLNVKLAGYDQTKGFLSQAKKEGGGVRILKSPYHSTRASFYCNSEFKRLQAQTGNMLRVTPDSYVIVYSTNGFVVVPATSVNGLSAKGTLYATSAVHFFREFLKCFIGDPRLKAGDPKSLESLRIQNKAQKAILMQVIESKFEENQDMRVFY
jgi:hypothetical protein